MDALLNALLFAHFLGLMLGSAATLTLVAMTGQQAAANPEQSPTLFRLGSALAGLSHAGFLLLLVSGPLLLWLKYGGFGGVNGWFHVKLSLVVVVIITIILSARALRRFKGGEQAALAQLRLTRLIALVALIGVVLAAVLAFQ
jgi:putative membrane protein